MQDTFVTVRSGAQVERLEQLRDEYADTRFDVCGQDRFSCALLVEFEDMKGAGEFWVTPAGRVIEPRPRPLAVVAA